MSRNMRELLDAAMVFTTAAAVFNLLLGCDIDALVAAGAGFTCLLLDEALGDSGR